jgi:hypothetical protein
MSASKLKSTTLTKTGAKKTGKKSGKKKQTMTDEERYRMIQESAYYIAEKAGFKGDNVQYWLEAEKEIKNLLK